MNTQAQPEPLEEYPSLLTVAEIKDIMRIGLRQAYDLCKQPDFPAIRIGASIRIPKKALLEWMETQVNEQGYDNPFRIVA